MQQFFSTLFADDKLKVLAFIVGALVAALVLIALYRLLFGPRIRGGVGGRRQPRLGVVDAYDLDRQRQLVLVRRDNVEHLIMIGGPNDMLIESRHDRPARARDDEHCARRRSWRQPSAGCGGARGSVFRACARPGFNSASACGVAEARADPGPGRGCCAVDVRARRSARASCHGTASGCFAGCAACTDSHDADSDAAPADATSDSAHPEAVPQTCDSAAGDDASRGRRRQFDQVRPEGRAEPACG